MRDIQRRGLGKDIKDLLAGPGPYHPFLDHYRVLWGATREEVADVVRAHDPVAAQEYETHEPRTGRGSSISREVS